MTGEEEDPDAYDGYTFGYSCIDMGNPYFDTLQKSIETSLKEKEFHLITKDPGSDAALQNQQIQEMIDEGVDAVFLCPVDWEQITPALEALKGGEYSCDQYRHTGKETDLVAAYIGSDNKNAGHCAVRIW